MITLPQTALLKPVAKPGGATELQGNDSENMAEDFLLLVGLAKAGLAADAKEATELPQTALHKASAKRDDLIKRAAELPTSPCHAASQEMLAALLDPAAKSHTAASKMLLADQDKGETDDNADLQAISALLAMLPQQQSSQKLAPTLTGKAPVSNDMQTQVLAGHSQPLGAQPLGTQPPEANNGTKNETNSGAGRFTSTDEKMNLHAAADTHISTVASTQTPPVPAISSSTPVISTGAPITSPATPILNSQLGSQEWQQQLSQQVVLFTRQGLQHAELRLHPEHLGKVEISMQLDDNQLQLQIMSPHNHVRAALEAAIPVLRTSLSESGLQLSQSQVGGEGSMQQQYADQREQQTARQNGTFTLEPQDDEDAPLAISGTLQKLAQSAGGVDTFA